MPDERERLVEAAIRPFGIDSESKFAARERVAAIVAQAKDRDVHTALDRWTHMDGKGKRGWWIWIPLPIAAFIFLLLLPSVILPVIRLRNVVAALGGSSMFLDQYALPPYFEKAGLTAKQRLLLGDPKLNQVRREEMLWQSEPENPAYFARYAAAYQRHHKALPQDYFEISRRLDPDNAWFDIFGAAAIGSNSVRRVQMTPEEKDTNAPPRWEIANEESYHKALAVLRDARGKSRYQSYEEQVLRERIPLLPQRDGLENIAAIVYVAGDGVPGALVRSLTDVIRARISEVAGNGDENEFRELVGDSEFFIERLAGSMDHTMIGELILSASAPPVYRALQEASMEMGIEEDYPRLGAKSARLQAYADEKKRDADLRSRQEAAVVLETRGSLITGLTIPLLLRQVRTAPPIREEDLKPARLAEQDVFAIMAAVASFATIVLSVIAVFFYRCRASRAVRILGGRMRSLLAPSDWMWIAVGGLVFPAVWVLGTYVCTSWGGRDHALSFASGQHGLFQPLGQFLGLTGLFILMPLLIVRWRLEVRGRAFGFRGRSWLGWLAAAGLAVFVVVYHPARDSAGSWVLLPLLAMQVWLLVVICRALFSRPHRLLPRITTALVLFPAYSLALICLLIVMAGFGFSHRFWMTRNTFTKISAEFPAMSPYEYRVAKQLRKEIRQTLDGS